LGKDVLALLTEERRLRKDVLVLLTEEYIKQLQRRSLYMISWIQMGYKVFVPLLLAWEQVSNKFPRLLFQAAGSF